MRASGDEATKAPDPFAAAAMANGGNNPEIKPEASEPKVKKKSLFERVTGLNGNNAPKAEAPVPFKPKATMPPPHPAPVPEPKPEPTPSPALEQNQLGGLDESDRLPASQPEEDLLDIPAFLRRQAN